MGSNAAVVVLVFLLLMFLIGRELLCWYWKINEGIRLLREINEKLGRMSETPRAPDAGGSR